MSLLSAAASSATSGAAAPGLALDGRALDALRRTADGDPEAAVRQAAEQFEALFMQQLMKSMRAAVPKSGLFDGPGSDLYTGMLDSQLTQAMAGKPGGLAEIIAKQMTRHLNGGGAGAPRQADEGAPGGVAAGAGAAVGEGEGGPGVAGRRMVQDGDPLEQAGTRRLNPVQVAFVERMWPHAMAAQKKSGIPAAYVVGQAALESGWGRRDIRDADGNPSHNLFGIKATGGWQGRTVAVMTTEYVDGQPQKVVEQFRRYDSYEEAFTDWSRLMTRSTRYASVLKASTAADFARGLEQAGYATDPRYGEKLERTINQALQLKRRDL